MAHPQEFLDIEGTPVNLLRWRKRPEGAVCPGCLTREDLAYEPIREGPVVCVRCGASASP